MDDDSLHLGANHSRHRRRSKHLARNDRDSSQDEDDPPPRKPSTKKDKKIAQRVLSEFRSKSSRDHHGTSRAKASIGEDESETTTENSQIEIASTPSVETPHINITIAAPTFPNETLIRAIVAEMIEHEVVASFKQVPIEEIATKNMEEMCKKIQTKVEEKFAYRLHKINRSIDELESRLSALDGQVGRMGCLLDRLRRDVHRVPPSVPGGWDRTRGLDTDSITCHHANHTGGGSYSKESRNTSHGDGDDWGGGTPTAAAANDWGAGSVKGSFWGEKPDTAGSWGVDPGATGNRGPGRNISPSQGPGGWGRASTPADDGIENVADSGDSGRNSRPFINWDSKPRPFIDWGDGGPDSGGSEKDRPIPGDWGEDSPASGGPEDKPPARGRDWTGW